MSMRNLVFKLYHSKVLSRLFPTTVYCLNRELKDCQTVLDIGCGPNSPIQYCGTITYSVGVEPYTPYLEQSKRKRIHDRYLNKKIESLRFRPKSFDAVVMVEVLEHLPKDEGKKILEKIEKWAIKKVIVTTPNGFIEQKSLDGNKLQRHLSGWKPQELAARGYKVRGLAGFKFLHSNGEKETMGDDITSSIRFKMRLFWFTIATVSQRFTYFVPELALGTFNTKDLSDKITKTSSHK